MKKLFLLAGWLGIGFQVSAAVAAAPPVAWDAANAFAGWTEPVHCTMTRTGEVLKLELTGRDSSIANRQLALDPARYNRLDIVYRATGLPAATTGQVFFADRDQPRWVGSQYWRFYKLVSDGRWQTLTLRADAGTLADGVESWTRRRRIDKIRLDMADQYPGVIEIKSIRFSFEKVKSPLFAELPKWPAAAARLPRTEPVPANLSTPYFQGWMLRSPDDMPTKLATGSQAFTARQNAFAFRREFDAPADLRKALIQMTADDRFELFVNGRKVLENHQHDGWKKPQQKDITNLLTPGRKNLLAGYYRNLGGAGGMLLELTMLDAREQATAIFSDEHFRTALLPDTPAYLQPDFDDRAWQSMLRQSPPPALPWGVTLNYVDIVPRPELAARLLPPATADAGSRIELQMRGRGMKPLPGSRVTIQLTAPDTTPLKDIPVIVERVMLKSSDAGEWTLSLPLQLPRWFGAESFRLHIKFKDYRLPAGNDRITLPVRPRPPEPSASYQVRKNAAGLPELRVNGQAVYPVIGSAQIHLNATGFEQVPMTFRTVWCRDRGFWAGDGDYRYSALDQCVQEVLESDPDAPILLWLGLDAPRWWGEQNPTELMRFQDGSHWSYGLATPSMASQKFRSEVTEMMNAMLDYCMNRAPYRDRIAGFVLCGGYSCEWQNWACHAAAGLHKLTDYSRPMQTAFARFAARNYPDLTESERQIPTFESRLRRDENHIFLPRDGFRRNLAYNDYLSQSVAELVEHLAKTARLKVGPDRLLGTYYGYTFEYTNLGWALQLSGHNALRKLLAVQELDFLLSPPSYSVRSIGDCGEDMKPFASIRAAGKLAIIDDDTRTDMTGIADFFQTVNRDQTRQVLRRNMGRTLTRMEPLCLLALNGGNEFSAPETVADLQKFKAAAAAALTMNARPNAEVAVVVSERAHEVMAMEKNKFPQGVRQWYNGHGQVSRAPRMVQPTVGESVCYQRSRLAQSGFAYDFILAEDLERVVDHPYKLWIFLNAFNPDARFAEAVRRLRSGPATLLWVRTPGAYQEGRAADRGFRKQLTGFDLVPLDGELENILEFPDGSRAGNLGPTAPLYQVSKAPGIKVLAEYEARPGMVAAAEIQEGRSKSIFYGGDVLKPDFLRQVAGEAGVHIYSTSDDILYANTHFLTFHAATAGAKSVELPAVGDVMDVFSGEVLARNTKTWRFHAALHETRVVFFGNAREFAAAVK